MLEEIAAGKHHHGPDGLEFMWQTPAGFKADQSGYLDYMALSIALADHPFADVKDNPALAESLRSAACWPTKWRRSRRRPTCGPLSLADVPAGGADSERHSALRARTSGKEPTVSDLNLPEAVSTDPFNGQPMHVVKKPEGWLIYAVDMNLKDQGGNVTPPIDCGFGPLPRVQND